MWPLPDGFEIFYPSPLSNEAFCSKFCNVKMKLPLKWIPLPNFRPQDQGLALQWPFKGIKVRGFFVDTSAMTPTQTCPSEPRKATKANQLTNRLHPLVCVISPSPLPGKPLPDNGLGWLNPDRCYGSSVNKKATPPFNAFKWPLQGQYLILWSEIWQRDPFKWHLHFSHVRIGTSTSYIGQGLSSDLGQGGATERPRASPWSLWHFPWPWSEATQPS